MQTCETVGMDMKTPLGCTDYAELIQNSNATKFGQRVCRCNGDLCNRGNSSMRTAELSTRMFVLSIALALWFHLFSV